MMDWPSCARINLLHLVTYFVDSRFVTVTNRLYFEYVLSNFTNSYNEPMIGAIRGNLISAPIELLTSKVHSWGNNKLQLILIITILAGISAAQWYQSHHSEHERSRACSILDPKFIDRCGATYRGKVSFHALIGDRYAFRGRTRYFQANWRIPREHYPLGWEHLKGGFLVLTMGYLISFATICAEICWATRYTERKITRNCWIIICSLECEFMDDFKLSVSILQSTGHRHNNIMDRYKFNG